MAMNRRRYRISIALAHGMDIGEEATLSRARFSSMARRFSEKEGNFPTGFGCVGETNGCLGSELQSPRPIATWCAETIEDQPKGYQLHGRGGKSGTLRFHTGRLGCRSIRLAKHAVPPRGIKPQDW